MDRKFSLLLLVSLLAACAQLPEKAAPDSATATLPDFWHNTAVANYSAANSIAALVEGAPIEHWLDSALAESPQIRQLELAAEQAALSVDQAVADRLPSVNLSSSVNRTKDADSNYSLKLSTSWEADLWGKLEDQQKISGTALQIQQLDLQYARRSLAANLISSWLSWVNSQKSEQVLHRQLELLQANEVLIGKRYQNGLGELSDLETAKSSTRQTEAKLRQQQENTAVFSRQLQQLSGHFKPQTLPKASWPKIEFPAINTPGQILGQRPDLIASYKRIIQADLQSQVAYKNLLPQLTLTADLSASALSGGDLLKADPVWSLLASLSQPVFNAGKLKTEQKKSELAAQQAYWSYRETLLAAMIEVEGFLAEEKNLRDQQILLKQAYMHALSSQKKVQSRYQKGLTEIETLIQSQQTTLDIENQLLSIELNRAVNRINLGLAIGLPIKEGA